MEQSSYYPCQLVSYFPLMLYQCHLGYPTIFISTVPFNEHIFIILVGYREKVITPEMLEEKAKKLQKRKQLADEKRENDKVCENLMFSSSLTWYYHSHCCLNLSIFFVRKKLWNVYWKNPKVKASKLAKNSVVSKNRFHILSIWAALIWILYQCHPM